MTIGSRQWTSIPSFVKSQYRLLPVLVGAVVGWVVLISGWNPLDADMEYDWLAAWGAWHGDAYADPNALATTVGVEIRVNVPSGTLHVGGHPRTPAAVLLSTPILAIPFEFIFAFSAALTAALVLILARSTPGWKNLDRVKRTILVAAFLAAVPTLSAVRYAGIAALVAVLTIWAWQAALDQRVVAAGFLVACAVSLKVYPAVLFFAWLFGRRVRPIVWGLFFGVLLNTLGLVLPGVSLTSSIAALSSASDTFLRLGANGSLVRFLAQLGLSTGWAVLLTMAVVAAVTGVLWARGKSFRPSNRFWAWVLIGLLVIPLSWISYDIVLYPLIGAWAISHSARHRGVGTVVLALWVMVGLIHVFVDVDLGWAALVLRILILLVEAWDPGPDLTVWSRADDVLTESRARA
jgi:hypothetical protein